MLYEEHFVSDLITYPENDLCETYAVFNTMVKEMFPYNESSPVNMYLLMFLYR